MHHFVKISVLLMLVAVLVGYTYVRAQDLLMSKPGTSVAEVEVNAPPPAATALVAHALKASYFDAAAGNVASCGSLNCSASVTMFNESIKCPAVAGNTCTFQIAIASGVQVAGNSGGLGEEGRYQFLVDGAAPSSGTDPSGFYEWSINEPNSGALFGTSSSVAGRIKNTVSSQAHTVAVNLGCLEIGRDSQGCVAVANFPSLHIAVFTP
jgi:hypothetical protein